MANLEHENNELEISTENELIQRPPVTAEFMEILFAQFSGSGLNPAEKCVGSLPFWR